ncbi:MAG TPA: serine hydrolase [Pyrinomonadaceae bacterium]|jgi:CubicO group peptidase (beta-lactamase class C family)
MLTVKVSFFLGMLFALVSSPSTSLIPTTHAQVNSAQQLAGLWEAKRRFGSDVGGSLIVRQSGGEWRAEIVGRVAVVKVAGDALTFELPDGKGSFNGKFDSRRTKIVGHWIQPATISNGTPYASPVTLTKDKQNIWRGEVSPLDDTLTFYLMVKPREDGSVGAFLRNPERNLGRFMRVDHLERAGATVKLFAANSGNEKGRLLAEGKYDDESEVLTIFFPMRGGSFDFQRVNANAASDFYPRSRPTANYIYTPPPSLDDGWQTASLEDVGISRAGIEKFIQMIVDTPIESVSSQEVHGVLIARHGKLVLEEYFHGEHREKPHDTRSAAKSLTATLVGASIKAGVPVDVSSPVYRVMNGGEFPHGIEPRKKALTLESLLTMSSGLDCDDADPKSPGGEDTMQEQTEQPDYYQFALALKMIREPGEKAVYCSVQSNLVGGVLARAAKQSLPTLFQNLVAEPLQIRRYYMNLTPTGDAYMGGGVRFLPRDFMKLAQLHLNGGTWNGRKVLTPEWSRRATSHLVNIGTGKYGYQWWMKDYPYQGRTVRAFFAGGNGGQIVMGIPELDLVVAFYGGNYSDPALFVPQNVYVPQYILPAVNAHAPPNK